MTAKNANSIQVPYLYMMIGLPGSGKSTAIQKLIDQGYVRYLVKERMILSTDKFIEAKAHEEGKHYHEVFEKYIGAATAQIEVDLKEAINKNADIFWDQTNLSAKSRAKKLEKIPKHYIKVALVFVLPDDKLQAQLDGRASQTGKFISPKVVSDMKKTFEYPTFSEGFNEIVDMYKPLFHTEH